MPHIVADTPYAIRKGCDLRWLQKERSDLAGNSPAYSWNRHEKAMRENDSTVAESGSKKIFYYKTSNRVSIGVRIYAAFVANDDKQKQNK
jgi:hypothetical protein